MDTEFDLDDPDVLNKIAEAIKNGHDASEFDDLIDELIGTGFDPSDPEKDQIWQDSFGSKDF